MASPTFKHTPTHRSTEDALKNLPLADCEVVLLDLSLPGGSGIDCAHCINPHTPRHSNPSTPSAARRRW